MQDTRSTGGLPGVPQDTGQVSLWPSETHASMWMSSCLDKVACFMPVHHGSLGIRIRCIGPYLR
jgi:hypothetical protein